MQKTTTYCTGYILAGGRSSRMGNDKGLLKLKGKPIISYVIAALQEAVDRIVIVSNNELYRQFGLEVIPDLVKDKGPAGGIYTALSHSDTQLNFISSCDMPFISPEAIRFMIGATAGHQIVLPEYKGNIEPMFGVYTKASLPSWKHLMDQGTYKLATLASHSDLNIIKVDDHALFSENTFLNINTKTDFEDALKRIKNEN